MPEIIDSFDRIQSLMNELSSDVKICAIDTEADSLHRYKESLCLIQLSAAGKNVILDPLAIEDMAPLATYLDECQVWMHGADYDMTMLKREFGRLPYQVWDTQIGARLLGLKKFGLSDLVKHWFGVTLLKTSQKADWGKRPLTEKMLDYAINDVVYLLPLGECIVEELMELGRYEWFVESCQTAYSKVMARNDSREDLWRINGSGRLNPRGLCFLKYLWLWRETEAALWDKPTFMVLNNKDMILWAEMLADDKPAPLPRHLARPDRLKRFEAALAPAHDAHETDWPQKIRALKRKKDSAFEKELDELIRNRNEIADQLQIDPSLIISRSNAEAIVAKEVCAQTVLMNWQSKLLGI